MENGMAKVLPLCSVLCRKTFGKTLWRKGKRGQSQQNSLHKCYGTVQGKRQQWWSDFGFLRLEKWKWPWYWRCWQKYHDSCLYENAWLLEKQKDGSFGSSLHRTGNVKFACNHTFSSPYGLIFRTALYGIAKKKKEKRKKIVLRKHYSAAFTLTLVIPHIISTGKKCWDLGKRQARHLRRFFRINKNRNWHNRRTDSHLLNHRYRIMSGKNSSNGQSLAMFTYFSYRKQISARRTEYY